MNFHLAVHRTGGESLLSSQGHKLLRWSKTKHVNSRVVSSTSLFTSTDEDDEDDDDNDGEDEDDDNDGKRLG